MISKVFCFLLMIYFHIFDDYVLQGKLASMKQKIWWKEQTKNPLYKYDYIIALFMHSMSWSFSIMLPIAIYFRFNVGFVYLAFFVSNSIIHAVIDNLKANEFLINLICDQLLHILQIIFTFLYFIYVF